MLGNIKQSLDNLGRSIETAASMAKEVKPGNVIQTTEAVELTTRDFYHTYWHCRDFELNHLWQHSIFLSAFIIICFSAYGYLALDMLEMLRTTETPQDKTQYWNVAHNAAIFISSVGSILSVLWILMAKGSKAWYEIYEAAIAAYEKDTNFLSPDAEKRKIGGFQYNGLPLFKKEMKGKLNNNLFSASGGAYSPSRINWVIGMLMLVVWMAVMSIHIVGLFPDTDYSGLLFGCIIALVAVILGGLIVWKVKSKAKLLQNLQNENLQNETT